MSPGVGIAIALLIFTTIVLLAAYFGVINSENVSGSLTPPLPVSRSQVSMIIFLLVVLTFFTVLPWVISAAIWLQAGNAVQTSPASQRGNP